MNWLVYAYKHKSNFFWNYYKIRRKKNSFRIFIRDYLKLCLSFIIYAKITIVLLWIFLLKILNEYIKNLDTKSKNEINVSL